MIKKVGLILFILLSFNLVSALDITLTKASYFTGETLQAEISGNFIDKLTLDNIGVYLNGSVHKTSGESGLIKSGSKYLFYAVLLDNPGDYYLKIDNTKYYTAQQKESSEPIIKNFEVTITNQSYLSFNPGFIYTSKDFEIKIRAYNKDQQVNVEFAPTKFKQTVNLGYGEEKTIYFSVASIKNITTDSVKIGSYSIPTTIVKSSNINNSIVEILPDLEDIIRVEPKEVTATILKDTNYYFEISIKNIEKISLDLNISCLEKELVLGKTHLDNFENSERINITVNSKRSFNTSIKISSEDESIKIPVNIIITQNESKVDFTQTPNQDKTCSSLGGIKCDSSKEESCQGTETAASDGWCCMGSCQAKSSSGSWVFGLILIILLGVGLWFVYKKSKENLSKNKAEDILKKRTEDFKKRIEVESPKEVRKSLRKD